MYIDVNIHTPKYIKINISIFTIIYKYKCNNIYKKTNI
jgi:hypothetical protein